MNQQFITNISDMVFIQRQYIFSKADVVIYHPGHFPELNIQIFNLYKNEGFNHLYIPDIHNNFLEANEFMFHKLKLLELGIPEEIIYPITGEFKDGSEVVLGAVKQLTSEMNNVLLAGKAFFCRRFLILATLNNSNRIFDVLPLIDDRGFDKENWYKSDKGKARVFNEIKVINNILNGLD
ncbi:hypothetical protein QPK24_10890 [Paenibacillus polygoni]|uniref:Uncharacterized protein n=1 Tax=Paenibacillus polygoni TaxID=3050112 RepID=A0ABY8X8V4_9BACL|nr:hypothetical protein [Paenibacillus polygoni]WIV21134.1 hypothetical protein QPK24_10890 [Paenibacillus polygoni]